MTRISLADTLGALIEGVTPTHAMLRIQEAEISLPLLVRMEYGANGPLFFAQPPYSAYHAGIDPVAHRVRLRIEPVSYPISHSTPPFAMTVQTAIPATPATPDPAG